MILLNTPFTVTKKGRATYISYQLWPICSLTIKGKEATLYNLANMTPNLSLYVAYLQQYLDYEGYTTTVDKN